MKFGIVYLLLLPCWLLIQGTVNASENPDFLHGLGLYDRGNGNPEDFAEALGAFKRAVEQGNEASNFYLGRMYQLGHGVDQDLEQAASYFLDYAEGGFPDAWINLADVYGLMGEAIPKEKLLECYENASRLGVADGSYGVAATYFEGLFGYKKDYNKALLYFKKTSEQQADYPNVWLNIGRTYSSGGYGLPRDYEKAEQAFLKAIEVSQDKYAYYNLYLLYKQKQRPDPQGNELPYLLKAFELGYKPAAVKLAAHFYYGGGVKKDLIRAAYYYEIAAKNGHGFSMYELSRLSHDESLIAHYGDEVTSGWRDYYTKHGHMAEKKAEADLAVAKLLFDQGKQAESIKSMLNALERWKKRTLDAYTVKYLSRYWSEAHVRSGRSDLEWSAFVYAWLAEQFDRDRSLPNARINARTSLASRLVELGCFGRLREVSQETKDRILAWDGIDVDSFLEASKIGSDFSYTRSIMPMQVDYGRITLVRGEREKGELISSVSIAAMNFFSQERLSIGDWEAALFYAEWMERWAHHIESSGVEPLQKFPSYYPVIYDTAYSRKADVFIALGLNDRAASAYRSIIEKEYGAYGGRGHNGARLMLALLQFKQGQDAPLGLSDVLELEEKLRQNRFATSHTWQYGKLVRAYIIASNGDTQSALSLIQEVLSYTLEEELPLLRLEALLTATDIALNTGMTKGCSVWLEEALSWARSQGLLIEELRIYEQYVRYLIAVGDYDLALKMQERVLELINALNLVPRRDRSRLVLAEIYTLMKRSSAAKALLAQIKDPSLVGRVVELLAMVDAESQESASQEVAGLDLQPLRIVSAPMGEQAHAVFMLTNPSPEVVKFDLKLTGRALRLGTENASEMNLSFEFQAVGEAESDQHVKSAAITGSSQLPIHLSIPQLGDLEEYGVGMSIHVDGQGAELKSEWMVDLNAGSALVAVVDAAYIRDNPFYLASVFHHLERGDAAVREVALRAVASEPTRIEAYDNTGRLLFVDSEGNGSFADSGDLVASEQMHQLSPVINLGGELQLEFRYQPLNSESTERVEVRIETLTMGGSDDWETSVVDWLER